MDILLELKKVYCGGFCQVRGGDGHTMLNITDIKTGGDGHTMLIITDIWSGGGFCQV